MNKLIFKLILLLLHPNNSNRTFRDNCGTDRIHAQWASSGGGGAKNGVKDTHCFIMASF